MQLLVTFAFVLVLMFSYAVQPSDHGPSWERILLIPICIGMPICLTFLFSKLLAKTDSSRQSPQSIHKKLRYVQAVHLFGWIVGSLAVYGPLQWIQIVRFDLQMDGLFLIDEIVILLPMFISSLAILVFSNWCEHRFYADAYGVESASRRIDWKTLRLQVSFVYLLPMIPVFVVLIIGDLGTQFGEIGRYSPYLGLPLVLLLPIFFPILLRYIWDVQDFPNGELRASVHQILSISKIKVSQVYLWQSNNRLVNAAVAGVVPWIRFLFLSDGLVERLNKDEINAIVAHEAAHVRHRHPLLTIISVGLPLGLSLLLLTVFEERQMQVGLVMECASVALVFVIWLLFQRTFSRLMEHHADIHACRIIEKSPEDRITPKVAHVFCESLEKLANGASRGTDWWHPSIDVRQSVLMQFTKKDAVLTAFDRRFQTISRLVVGTVIILSLANIGIALIA